MTELAAVAGFRGGDRGRSVVVRGCRSSPKICFVMADAVRRNIDALIKRLDELLHDKNFWLVAQLDQLEQKTGVKRVHVALGRWLDESRLTVRWTVTPVCRQLVTGAMQWRIQKFWKGGTEGGGLKTACQPCRRLSQIHTTNYMTYMPLKRQIMAGHSCTPALSVTVAYSKMIVS